MFRSTGSLLQSTLMRLAFISLLIGLQTPISKASSFYYEIQGGLSQIRGGDPFFASGISSVADLGTSFNFTFGYSFTGGEIPLEFQGGLQYRLTLGSDGSNYFGTHAPFVVLRMQMSMIYIGAGFAPYVWKRFSTTPSLENFSLASGSMGGFIDAGGLWAVTPQFSLGAALTGLYIYTSGTFSPKPAFEATAIMRFYFGFSKSSSSSSSSRSSNEFKGWRYPFGNYMN